MKESVNLGEKTLDTTEGNHTGVFSYSTPIMSLGTDSNKG